MNLMLLVILLCVGLGLVGQQFGRRKQVIIGAVATTMTMLYLSFARFM